MGVAGTLEIFAEIAIAIAGFSGVVAALHNRGSDKWTPADKARLVLLLRLSLGVALFSLIPLILISTDLEVSTVWSGTSAMWIVYTAVILVFFTMRLMRRVGPLDQVSGRLRATMYIGTGLAMLLQGLNVAVLHSAWPHLVALLWALVGAAVNFIRLVQSVWFDEGRAA